MSDRYSRQILFRGIGAEGQAKIRGAAVTVIGCGALGSASAEMLARAGVGTLTIVDRDFVEISNLQRQSLFAEEDVRLGIPKAVAAEKALRSINSDVHVSGRVEDVNPDNIEELCGGSEIVIDGTDNFETRYLVNDACVKLGLPWVYGACIGSYGVSFVFEPGVTACLQCLFPTPPEVGSVATCETAGILGPVARLVASWQVAQTLRVLVGLPPSRRILQVDVWTGDWHTIPTEKMRAEDCACCVGRRFRFLEGAERMRGTGLCGRNAVQVNPGRESRLDFTEISQRLAGIAKVDFNQYMMKIEVGSYEIALFPNGRSIIKGTHEPSEARAIYAKYIGS